MNTQDQKNLSTLLKLKMERGTIYASPIELDPMDIQMLGYVNSIELITSPLLPPMPLKIRRSKSTTVGKCGKTQLKKTD